MSRTTIVVGSGSTGGALASRLSEHPDENVILVEAGPDYATADDLPEQLRDAFNPQLEGPHDWAYTGYMVEPHTSRAAVGYPRGRVVGGSSTVNGAIAQRGYPHDFNAWAEMGHTEWSWDKVLPFYIKAENDPEFAGSPLHGTDGPVPIVRYGRDQWPPAVRAFEQAAFAQGFPECIDHNDPEASGIGRIPRNQVGDRRAGTLLTYVAQARGRQNFQIRDNTQVRRVLFDGTRAVGVEAEHNGEVITIEGDRVVLCGGFINSPQILMLSGIGPRRDLEAIGITPLIDLPGVGQNVLDHAFAPIIGLASDPEPDRFGFRCELKYTSARGVRNDIQIFPCLLELSSLNFEVETDLTAAILVGVVLGKPRSKGTIRLTSNDPKAPPEVRMNFLADPIDRARMVEAVRTVYRLMTSDEVSHELHELLFPTPVEVADDGQLERWLLENITTGFHGASSCRMGIAGDSNAVVDQYLKVHGAEELYVADASIMPDITTGMTNLTCYMIGERAAELLTR